MLKAHSTTTYYSIEAFETLGIECMPKPSRFDLCLPAFINSISKHINLTHFATNAASLKLSVFTIHLVCQHWTKVQSCTIDSKHPNSYRFCSSISMRPKKASKQYQEIQMRQQLNVSASTCSNRIQSPYSTMSPSIAYSNRIR